MIGIFPVNTVKKITNRSSATGKFKHWPGVKFGWFTPALPSSTSGLPLPHIGQFKCSQPLLIGPAFPSSYLQALSSQSSSLSHAFASGNFSVNNAHVFSQRTCDWKHGFSTPKGVIFWSLLTNYHCSSGPKDGEWEADLRRSWRFRIVDNMTIFGKLFVLV